MQPELTTRYTKLANGISLFLGAIVLPFGVLKFFDPINGWYRAQIELGGLPQISYYPGIFGEITVGFLFLLPLFFRRQLGASQKTIRKAASAMLILTMIVAVYVHLQPAVPAAVLPLKIKPPFIPGFVMALAVTNFFMLSKEK